MASRSQARVMAWRTALSARGPEEALNMMWRHCRPVFWRTSASSRPLACW